MEKQEVSLDFNRICRLCMMEELHMKSIFIDQSNVIPLHHRILSCLSVEIAVADLLPSQICNTCLFLVENLYKFKDLCVNSDTFLRRLVANENAIDITEIAKIRNNGRDLKSKFVAIVQQSANTTFSYGEEVKLEGGSLANNQPGEVRQYEELNESKNWSHWPGSTPNLILRDSAPSPIYSDDDTQHQLFSEEGFSTDDSLTLLAHKEKLIKVKQMTKKRKPSKERVQEKRLSRTTQTQTGDDIEDSAVEISIAEVVGEEKKKKRNKRTQTCQSKKRFRIRPAVRSACTLCEKVYKNGEILRQHMKSHHVSGSIECQQCKATFTSLRSLKYHEQRNHSNLEPVPCSFCGKEFLDKKYLRIHENIHSKANQYVCQFCGRNFIMKTNLTVHISRHHTQKTNDFICQVCGKAFPFKLYLKKHFKTHTDYKPHCCSHCDARFRESTLLRKHINSIHLKLRPFLCTYCQKTFTRRLYLREHMDSQHLGNPRKVECDRCGEIFNNRTKTRQHDCQDNLQIL